MVPLSIELTEEAWNEVVVMLNHYAAFADSEMQAEYATHIADIIHNRLLEVERERGMGRRVL